MQNNIDIQKQDIRVKRSKTCTKKKNGIYANNKNKELAILIF